MAYPKPVVYKYPDAHPDLEAVDLMMEEFGASTPEC